MLFFGARDTSYHSSVMNMIQEKRMALHHLTAILSYRLVIACLWSLSARIPVSKKYLSDRTFKMHDIVWKSLAMNVVIELSGNFVWLLNGPFNIYGSSSSWQHLQMSGNGLSYFSCFWIILIYPHHLYCYITLGFQLTFIKWMFWIFLNCFRMVHICIKMH